MVTQPGPHYRRVRVLSGRGTVAGERHPAPLALAIYGAMALFTIGISVVRGTSPLDTEPLLDLPEWSRWLVSVIGGGVLAFVTVSATRLFVKRWGWAKLLHADLRPVVRGASSGAIVVLGSASALAEELFFRGLLTPAIGLFLSSLAFGALHRLRGRAGFIWATWAGVMGLAFGLLFLLTGSLLGAIAAHAAINVMNLRFLRDTDVEPKKPRRLGGLLGQA